MAEVNEGVGTSPIMVLTAGSDGELGVETFDASAGNTANIPDPHLAKRSRCM